MRKIVAGNWKMNKDRSGAIDLIEGLVHEAGNFPDDVEVIIAPPFPFLALAVERTRGSGIVVAAQNCHHEIEGAYTGEVSIPMLESIGVGGCIIGHSERRQYFHETDALAARKLAAVLEGGLLPIYCCGEKKEEREAGDHFKVVGAQMKEAFGPLDHSMLARMVVAYEPVWAIGTGLTASPEQAQEMHAFIRKELRSMAGDVADAIPILYGGSCNAGNAESLFKQQDVNGGLIGGASLKADQFLQLINIAGRI